MYSIFLSDISTLSLLFTWSKLNTLDKGCVKYSTHLDHNDFKIPSYIKLKKMRFFQLNRHCALLRAAEQFPIIFYFISTVTAFSPILKLTL